MKVNTDELVRQASQLQNAARRLSDIQDSVARIAINMSRESEGERFRRSLLAAIASIGRRNDEVKMLRTALNQIAEAYERSEVQIVDEAQNAAVHYLTDIVGRIALPPIVPAPPAPHPRNLIDPEVFWEVVQGDQGVTESPPVEAGEVTLDWTPWDP